MEDSALLALVEEILETEPGTVSASDSLDDVEWDSLSNISFIAEVDARLGITVDAEELSRASTVADILALVQNAANKG